MQLIGFTEWHNANYEFIGGFEDESLAGDEIEWINYEEKMTAWEVTVRYLRRHGIRFTGIYHQKGRYGVPFFDNGKKLCLDQQAWGYLMAEALELAAGGAGSAMAWCRWAWCAEPGDFVLPYGERPEDAFHWKNDPLARAMVEKYLCDGSCP